MQKVYVAAAFLGIFAFDFDFMLSRLGLNPGFSLVHTVKAE